MGLKFPASLAVERLGSDNISSFGIVGFIGAETLRGVGEAGGVEEEVSEARLGSPSDESSETVARALPRKRLLC